MPALTEALKDKDAQVRYSAVGALHALDPKGPQAGPAIEGLLAALRDSDARVRALAAGILSTLKPDPKLALPELIAAAKADRRHTGTRIGTCWLVDRPDHGSGVNQSQSK